MISWYHNAEVLPGSVPTPAIRALVQPVIIAICAVVTTSASAGTDDGIAFFESRIRPVLVQSCYKCHSSQSNAPKGGLRVDSREALLRGGESGPAIVPGKPGDSLLFMAVSYEGDAVEMPPKEKLPAEL